jgi:hypothetical protein
MRQNLTELVRGTRVFSPPGLGRSNPFTRPLDARLLGWSRGCRLHLLDGSVHDPFRLEVGLSELPVPEAMGWLLTGEAPCPYCTRCASNRGGTIADRVGEVLATRALERGLISF